MTDPTEPTNTHCGICGAEFQFGAIITTYLTWSAGKPGLEQRGHLHCAVDASREHTERHPSAASRR
ncbi:hypothetical protein [Burkholderia gladioli]|uniref:hypothetical protein n=1 Tax=Burkholderia gladioli TaxID=28095 RepID=UPI001641DBA0|nr:hypothetical protein [Burkholderia gladioli]